MQPVPSIMRAQHLSAELTTAIYGDGQPDDAGCWGGSRYVVLVRRVCYVARVSRIGLWCRCPRRGIVAVMTMITVT